MNRDNSASSSNSHFSIETRATSITPEVSPDKPGYLRPGVTSILTPGSTLPTPSNLPPSSKTNSDEGRSDKAVWEPSAGSQSAFFCLECGDYITNFQNGFVQHMRDHHPYFEHRCTVPGCEAVRYRLDEFSSHFRTQHARDASFDDMATSMNKRPCPRACAICGARTSSWDEFDKCITNHYQLPDLSNPANQAAATSNSTDLSSIQPAEMNSNQATDGSENVPAVTGKRSPSIPERSQSHLEDGGNGLRNKRKAGSVEPSSQPGAGGSADTGENKRCRLEPTDTRTVNPRDLLTNENDRQTELYGPQWRSESSISSDPAEDSPSSTQTDITQPGQSDDDASDPGGTHHGNLDHILNATAYYERLDMLELNTAKKCGIHSGPRVQNGALFDCLRTLPKCRDALYNLQSEGFCGSMFSILVEDEWRPGVANAVHISSSEIKRLVDSLQLHSAAGPWYQDCLTRMLEKLLGSSSSRYRHASSPSDLLPYVQFLSAALPVGLLSFSGSHVCRFDLNIWGQSMDCIPVGLEYSFKPRDLACLTNFVGGPAWVLGREPQLGHKTQTEPMRLKLSLTVQDLQELWGPVWLVGRTADEGRVIRTERGYIIPLPREEQSDASLDEIECHWTKEIPAYITQNEPILLRSTSRILIGTDSVGLTVNHACESQVQEIQWHVHHELQFSGTCNEYNTVAGHEVQLTGGQYANLGLVRKYKRIPMRTMKSALIDAFRNPGTDFRPLLKLRVGLEISACTGNSRRVTLWDALRLSQTRAITPPDRSPYCEHMAGDPQCIQSCWTRCISTNCLDSPFNTPEKKDEAVRSILLNSILMLEHTGIDPAGDLQACWPFLGGNWSRRIASTRFNKWIQVVTDTRDAATFAVASQRCLVFDGDRPAHGRRTCPRSYMDGPDQRTCLSSRVLPLPVPRRNATSALDFRQLGLTAPVPECDLGELPSDAMFRVGQRYLTVKKIYEGGHHKVMVAVTSSSLGMGSWKGTLEFREQINPDIKGGEPVEVVACSKYFGPYLQHIVEPN